MVLCSQASDNVGPCCQGNNWVVQWFEQDNEDQQSPDSIVEQLWFLKLVEDMWQAGWLVSVLLAVGNVNRLILDSILDLE